MTSGQPAQTMQGNQWSPATRKCRSCLEEKPYVEMVKSKAFSCGIDTICLDCSRNRVKVWRKKNPDKLLKQVQREYGKPYTINKHLRSKYGITHIEYDTMYELQQGCCKICATPQSLLSKRLSVDHCHITGKVRGLLCTHCNSMLGYAKDKTELLEKAIGYLKENNGSS